MTDTTAQTAIVALIARIENEETAIDFAPTRDLLPRYSDRAEFDNAVEAYTGGDLEDAAMVLGILYQTMDEV